MRSLLVLIIATSLLVGLGGCLGDTASKPDNSSAVAAPPPPTPGLTPSERNILAIELLNEGKADQARAELQASLAELPAARNPRAQNLLSQIDDDPVAILGRENWRYKVQRGESLSIIAGNYLGDTLKFFVLARYNDMDNPSLLKAGQVIKVPGEKPQQVAAVPASPAPETAPPEMPAAESTPPEAPPADSAMAETPPEMPAENAPEANASTEAPMETPPPPVSTPEKPPVAPVAAVVAPDIPAGATPAEQETEEKMRLFAQAREQFDAQNYPGAVEIIESGLKKFPDDKLFKVFGADVYGKFGGSLLEQDVYKEAAVLLERAATLDPDNDTVGRLLDDAKQANRADRLYQDGQRYEKEEAKIEALEAYQAALKVWPEHNPAQVALANVTPEVAGIYYREGRAAFQRQCLKAALDFYEKALAVDPNHEPAKLDRQRTKELLGKLGDSSC